MDPIGCQLGFSFFPSPWVNWRYFRSATSMVNMLKAPVAYPWVQAKAMICPFGCQDGLVASPLPGVNRSMSAPSILIV